MICATIQSMNYYTLPDYLKFNIHKTKFFSIFDFIILYSPIIPGIIYGLLDIVQLVYKNRLEKSFYKDNDDNKNKYFFEIQKPEVLSDLGHVDYIFMDKTRTLTTGKFKIENISINSC